MPVDFFGLWRVSAWSHGPVTGSHVTTRTRVRQMASSALWEALFIALVRREFEDVTRSQLRRAVLCATCPRRCASASSSSLVPQSHDALDLRTQRRRGRGGAKLRAGVAAQGGPGNARGTCRGNTPRRPPSSRRLQVCCVRRVGTAQGRHVPRGVSRAHLRTCAWTCAAFDTCTPNPACLPTRRPLRAFSPGRLPPRPAAWSAVMENGIISSCCTRRPRRPCSLLARASTTSSMHSGARGAGASFVSQNTASWCWVGFALVRACVRACTHLLCA